eukprot:scaffold12845_cov87-Cyclotella_meneghiniana.AAC.2
MSRSSADSRSNPHHTQKQRRAGRQTNASTSFNTAFLRSSTTSSCPLPISRHLTSVSKSKVANRVKKAECTGADVPWFDWPSLIAARALDLKLS